MTAEYQFKKLQLINYLKLYLSKKLNMNIIFIIIINKLKNNHKITLNQYNSIIKFIEREPKLINRDRDYIFNYFSPLIHNIEKESNEPNTLCKFIQ
jgi:hypothetical protein